MNQEYIYEYENGKRIRNLGFLKMKKQPDKFTIEIYARDMDEVKGIWLQASDGRKYLAWGSFHGIYLTELTEDGLEVDDIHNLTRIAGTAYEGTYIHKRGDYYYLFASTGSCCEGLKSTYQTVVGRSKSLYGPYVDKNGGRMLDNCHEILLSGDENVKGTGHDSQIITDDRGQDWIFYHAYDTKAPNAGRKMYMDRVTWVDGWPQIGVDEWSGTIHQEVNSISIKYPD